MFLLDNEYIMEVFKEHEHVLLDLFNKDEIINNFDLIINTYLKSFNIVSETFQIVENSDKNLALILNDFPKIHKKHKDIVDFVQQNIPNFDYLYHNIKLKDNPKKSSKFDEILFQILQTGIISKTRYTRRFLDCTLISYLK